MKNYLDEIFLWAGFMLAFILGLVIVPKILLISYIVIGRRGRMVEFFGRLMWRSSVAGGNWGAFDAVYRRVHHQCH